MYLEKSNTLKTNILQSSLFLKVNLLFTTLLSLGFLFFNKEYTFYSFTFTLFALISTVATLYFIFWLLGRAFFRFRATQYFLVLLFSFTNIVLLSDLAIYRVWGFHINGMVLNIMLSPTAYKSLYMTPFALFIIVLSVSTVIGFSILTLKKIRKLHYEKLRNIQKKMNTYLLPLLFVIFLYEKLTYAVANLHLNSQILVRSGVVPLYQPLTMNKFLVHKLHMQQAKSDNLDLKMNTISNLNYPLQALSTKQKSGPNIFIFGVDALRRSIISQETTPNIIKFEKESISFTNNISGGNNTRFGIFSLFYGINSSYWFAFLNAQKGTVLFDILEREKYQMLISSSADLHWPEFRKTIFIDVQKYIKDDFKGSPLQRDKQALDYFNRWLDKQDLSKPMFSFVWIDNVHASHYEKEFRKFIPDDAKNNYLTVNESEKVKQLNRYKNAALSADAKFGAFIQKLKEKNLYDNSIIILLSDHGQEFYEYGHFSHNSAYNEAQVKTPLIMHMPNMQAKRVEHLTSHLDIVPTLMKQLGVTNDVADYANGEDLFSPNYKRECAFVGNWNENAIVCNKYTIVISNIVTKSFNNAVYNTQTYKRVENYDREYVNRVLLNTLNENKKFTK